MANIASCVFIEVVLQCSLAEVHFGGHAPTGIFELAKEYAGAHLGIVAGTVVIMARYVEDVTQCVERVAFEIVQFACGSQGTVVGDRGYFNAVVLQRTTYATHVKGCIVSYKDRALLYVGYDLAPHLGKLRRMNCVLRLDAMYLYVVVVVLVALRLYKPRTSLYYLTIAHNAYTGLAYRFASGCGGLEVYGYKVYSLHDVMCVVEEIAKTVSKCFF